MTRAEYVSLHGCEPHDEGYWGPGGPDIKRWTGKVHMARGADYHVNGVDHGGPNQVRKISTGRKARGYASGTDGKNIVSPPQAGARE